MRSCENISNSIFIAKKDQVKDISLLDDAGQDSNQFQRAWRVREKHHCKLLE